MTWPTYSRECRKEIDEILRKGRALTAYRANASVGVGPAKESQVWRLEREIEKKFKVRHAVAVNSGTAALHSALEAVGVRGGEVVTTPYSFSATVSAIILAGGTPRFADISPHDFCINAETVRPVLNRRTKAILPVHLFGYLPPLAPLLGLGVPVVEDACQAVGANRGGRYAGAFGAVGCASLNGSKNIPAGEGGFITTNDDKIAEKARLIVNHGENFPAQKLRAMGVGYNYRLTEVTACIARHGLMELESRNQRRRELANVIKKLCPGSRPSGKEHVFYVMPFTLHKVNRPRFISRCAKRGLPIQVGYTTPLHRLSAFKKYQTTPLPVVEELHDKTLCLLTTLTPDRPLSYARWCAKVIREALE